VGGWLLALAAPAFKEITMSATANRVKAGLSVQRLFTSSCVTAEGSIDPLDRVEWAQFDSSIKGVEGVVFAMANVTAPKKWSQLAVDIAASKYFRKAGIPETGHETSVRQLVTRVARALRLAGERQEYFASPADAQAFEDEIKFLLVTQRMAFNSPVWFNLGLREAYDLTGTSAGNWFWNAQFGSVGPTSDSYTSPQVSACFIVTVRDDLMDIAEHVKREMRVFKYGSGAGANYSDLRAAGEPLSNGGTSSGVMSFLEVYDRAAGAIKSGGTTRRAAKLVVLDVDHPDIDTFIEWKAREEDKARVLIAAGYPSDFNGEAYRTVGGQNANNSVNVSDEFMRAAIATGGMYETHYRVGGGVAARKNARETLRKIADAAWRCADPGMFYAGNINKWHTCRDTSEIRAANPCIEYVFINDSACNLASLNLVMFDNADGFDVAAFTHAARITLMAQEILVDHASYPTREIAQNSHDYRPLGLGYANLGALLMRRGLAYDSDAGRAVAAGITSLMTAVAYDTSADMAIIKGAFPAFTLNRDSAIRVMELHRSEHQRMVGIVPGMLAADVVGQVWDRVVVKTRATGLRNAQSTLIAPTGTIGLLMGCDTTGVEPDYALTKEKKLAGGGKFIILNQSVGPALARLGYSEPQRTAILDYLKQHHKLEGAPGLREEHLPVFDCAARCGDGVRAIEPMGHVRMMEVVQPFLSGAISKTVNVPADTTVDQIEALYIEGWKRGLKALAIYRQDSKGCQVLTSAGAGTDKNKRVTTTRARLPKKRRGFTQEAIVGGQKVYLRTGEYEDGTLGEIFIDMHKEGATMRSMANVFAIAISLGLQHGVPLQEFVDAFTFSNFAPNGVVTGHPNIKHASSIIDYIFRLVALEYLNRMEFAHVKPTDSKPGETSAPALPTAAVQADGKVCASCGMLATRRNGNCYVCGNCGSQTGCA
jgi:ribonucleoside-diphosphate reductase alpha chain